MAGTLEVIKFRDIIRVTAITRIVKGLTPTTVEIRGEDFRSAERVFINDVEAPEFVVVNKTTIYVGLPGGVKRLKTISVVSSNFTRTAEASKVTFQVGSSPRRISGILRLTQLFVAWLLKSPGSDIFNPGEGGGLQDVVGLIGSTHKTEPLTAAIAKSVTTTADQIRRMQLTARNLPASERLLAARILSLDMLQERDEARVRIGLESLAGEDAIAGLAL